MIYASMMVEYPGTCRRRFWFSQDREVSANTNHSGRSNAWDHSLAGAKLVSYRLENVYD